MHKSADLASCVPASPCLPPSSSPPPLSLLPYSSTHPCLCPVPVAYLSQTGIWTSTLVSCWRRKMRMLWFCCSFFCCRQPFSCCRPRSCGIRWICRRSIVLSFCRCHNLFVCVRWSCTYNTSCFCLRWRCFCSCFWRLIWSSCRCEHWCNRCRVRWSFRCVRWWELGQGR